MGLFGSSENKARSKALSLYKRGMLKAKKNDHSGAITDYTASIDMADVPADVRAMSLFNRALVHAAIKNHAEAFSDLNAVLAIDAPVASIKAAAKQKLERLKRRARDDTPSP